MKKKKKTVNRISDSPYPVITNLSSWNLGNKEYKVLTYVLKHGTVISSKHNDILASNEALLDQLKYKNVLEAQRAKYAIRAMSFSLLVLDAQQITKDKRKIRTINNLLKDAVILKPDKRNRIMFLDINDYRTSVKYLFSDKSKF